MPLLLYPSGGAGVEWICLTVGNLEGAGIAIRELEIELAPLLGDRPELRARVGQLYLPATGDRIDDLQIRCSAVTLDAGGLHCHDGLVRARHPWLEGADAGLVLDWRPGDGYLRVQLEGLRLAGGDWRLALEGKGGQWALKAGAQGVDSTRLLALLMARGLTAPGWSARGRADLHLDARLDAVGLTHAQWRLNWHDGAFGDATGDITAEGLQAELSGSVARAAGGGLKGNLALRLAAGAALTPYAYLEVTDEPLRLGSDFDLGAGFRELRLAALRYRHPGVLAFQASGCLALDPLALRELHLETEDTPLEPLYRHCLEPVLSGTPVERVAWQGSARLALDQVAGASPVLTLELREVGLEDRPDPLLHPDAPARFELHGLDGRVAWSPDPQQAHAVNLKWRGGRLLQALDLGPATLVGELRGKAFRLTRPVALPLLDGSLMVDNLALRASATGPPEVDFDGILTPLSMERLSRAFGWPPLAGSLSGVVPGLSLGAGGLRVGGKLLVRVFDGEIVISGLRLDHLFDPPTVLSADVQVRNLDLETLTRTFSFGKITGRLDGSVIGLRLENWRPVAFDARLATPQGDDSPHYISQRAVENISDLGGAGIAGSLSRGFLGLFEEFQYDRLGISCRLADGVCTMGGVAPADTGYYLVVGRGIPQINIKGFTTRIDWRRLVQQLQEISASGAPVVK